MYSNSGTIGRKLGHEGFLRRYFFPLTLLVCFGVAIMLLMALDYLNMETFSVFNVEGFMFAKTWKGRMFYLFFLWLLLLELIISWEEAIQSRPTNNLRIGFFLVCGFFPLFYIFGVNFLGLGQSVISLGENLGFTGLSLSVHWPLSLEYLVFSVCFLLSIGLAYGKKGLSLFSISSGLLVGMTAIFTLDTFYPEGAFRPFEMLALPTAACAAALLEVLGYNFSLRYSPGSGSMPIIITPSGGAAIGWPCAGVHSLFLFTLIILILFKRSNISNFRKAVYFVVGGAGTYFVNVLRIASFFIILTNNGSEAAGFFHDSMGELYFIFWIFCYLLIVVGVERFRLVERTRYGLERLYSLLLRSLRKRSSVS